MPDDLRELWQKQELKPMTITVDEIRRCAGTLRHRVVWRNAMEYLTGGLVSTFFLRVAWLSRGWDKAPSILIVAGLAYMLYQLHRRAAAPAGHAVSGLLASLEWYRRELERQREALRSMWTWYLLPLVPGVAALSFEVAWRRGVSARYVGGLVFIVAGFATIWAINAHAARKLDRRIEEIRDMEEKNA